MKCKIVYARSRVDLENKINAWLEQNAVSPESMTVHYNAVGFDGSDEYFIEHTVILFYVPLYPMGLQPTR